MLALQLSSQNMSSRQAMLTAEVRETVDGEG